MPVRAPCRHTGSRQSSAAQPRLPGPGSFSPALSLPHVLPPTHTPALRATAARPRGLHPQSVCWGALSRPETRQGPVSTPGQESKVSDYAVLVASPWRPRWTPCLTAREEGRPRGSSTCTPVHATWAHPARGTLRREKGVWPEPLSTAHRPQCRADGERARDPAGLGRGAQPQWRVPGRHAASGNTFRAGPGSRATLRPELQST